MMMIILVDMDQVLTDFYGGWCRKVAEYYPEVVVETLPAKYWFVDDYDVEYRDKLRRIMHEPGFFRDLKPMPYAIGGFQALVRKYPDTYICTTPLVTNPTCIQDKFEWVARYLGYPWMYRTVTALDKTLIHGDVLIDDKPDIMGIREPTWKHVIYNQSYNNHVKGPHFTWAQFLRNGRLF